MSAHLYSYGVDLSMLAKELKERLSAIDDSEEISFCAFDEYNIEIGGLEFKGMDFSAFGVYIILSAYRGVD